MESIAYTIAKNLRLTWHPKASSFIHRCMTLLFKQYKPNNQFQPIDCVEHIRTDLPILIICSKQDTLVPYTSAIALYKKLRQSNHEHTYLLIVDYGKHGRILQQKDGIIYMRVTHAFYRRYNLQHTPEYAQCGELLLNKCQPTLQELGQK